MSTPSFIGYVTDKGNIRGIRTQWDGYPDTVGEWMAEFDDAEAFKAGLEKMLTESGWDWRGVYAKATGHAPEAFDDGDDRFEVAEYGSLNEAMTENSASYGYLLKGKTVTVKRNWGGDEERVRFTTVKKRTPQEWRKIWLNA